MYDTYNLQNIFGNKNIQPPTTFNCYKEMREMRHGLLYVQKADLEDNLFNNYDCISFKIIHFQIKDPNVK